MRSTAADADSIPTLIAALQRGALDEAAARRLYAFGPDVVALALLAAARRIAEQDAALIARDARIGELQRQVREGSTPGTPSGMRPVYAKPNAGDARTLAGRRRKRPGAQNGHLGHHRAAPLRIDQRVAQRLEVCPCCGGALQRCRRTRTRITEDLPETLRPVVIEHTIHRDYCPRCKKHVEPVVPDALPHATLGHRVVSFTSWCHYGLGVTIDQLIDILQFHLQTKLSAGGLVACWQRLAAVLTPWYEQIAQEARRSAHLHADETGWRVQGQTRWLWCFANGQVCYYLIDRNRGSPVVQKFFGQAFDGILLHDFWSAYESIDVGDRQYCLVHLLRELEKVDEQRAAAPRASDDDWQAFAKLLRRLIRDGIRLRKRPDFSPQRYARRIPRLTLRLDALVRDVLDRHAAGRPVDRDAVRLCKRLRRTGDHIFTFLDHPAIPFENNFAERMIRPAVVLRKNCQSNRSDDGAATQAVLMSVYRTLKLRGHDPLKTLEAALRTYLQTRQLPLLPGRIVAGE
jgi:transposase